MGPTVTLGYVVREAKDVFLVRIIPLQGRLDPVSLAVDVEITDRRIETRLVAVQIFDEGAYPAVVRVDVTLSGSLVRERDADPRVEKGEFPEPPGKQIVMELDVAERVRTRRENQSSVPLRSVSPAT